MALREASPKMCSLDDFLKVAYAWFSERTILSLEMAVFAGEDGVVDGSWKGTLGFSRTDPSVMRFIIAAEQAIDFDLSKMEIEYVAEFIDEEVVIRTAFRLGTGSTVFLLNEVGQVARA